MTSDEVKDLVERLQPRWVIDEPVGQAIVLLGFKPEWAPTVEALNRFLVSNNALKTEAAEALNATVARADAAEALVDKLREGLEKIEDIDFDGYSLSELHEFVTEIARSLLADTAPQGEQR